jgi:hypothetical protein
MEAVLSGVMLTAFVWASTFLIPNAIRERNGFGVLCSVLVALIGLLGWLLIGAHARSA